MRYILSIFILVTIMAIGHFTAFTYGFAWSPAQSLVAVGFLLLIAFSFGEVFRKIGLPSLLGYIAVGILFGPSLIEQLPFDFSVTLITPQVIADMHIVNVLVVGVIGMLAGGKFRVKELAGNVRLLLVLTASILVGVVSLITIGVLSLAQIFPTQLAFITTAPIATQVLIALFFGVIAFGLSSSTTVALIQEQRARGPLSTVVLGVVLLSEVVLFALFALLLAVGRYMASSEILTLGTIASHVPNVLVDLTLAILIGVGIGIISVLYLKYVRKEPLLFTLALIFVAYYAASKLGIEALLVFLAAGFFVQNASSTGDEMVRALERIGMPIFVVYFALIAAQLDLKVAAGYLPLVLGLIVLRTFALHFATRFASQRAAATNRAYDYLHISFFSQDAVVLVLAGVVATTFPEWGASFQNVTMATVVAYLIGGPILFKLALDRAGETQSARQRLAEEMDYRIDDNDTSSASLQLQAQLPAPEFADSWLRGAVEDLQEALVALDERWIRNPLLQQRSALNSFLSELHTLISGIVAKLQEQANKTQANTPQSESPTDHDTEKLLEQLAEAVRDGQKRFTNRLHPLLENVLENGQAPLSPDSMKAFMDAIRDLEDQQSILKVEREDELFDIEPGDGRLVKALKKIRRLRYRLRGPGYRTVPTGRLWRYYVELALPVSFARDTPTITVQQELFWRELWLYLRSLGELFENLHNALSENPDEAQLSDKQSEHNAPSAPDSDASPDDDLWFRGRQQAWLDAPQSGDSTSGDTSSGDTAVLDANPAAARASDTATALAPQQKRFQNILHQFQLTQTRRHTELNEILQRSTDIALHRYNHSMSDAYRAFLTGTAHAGTSELLPFQYRPASRFDQAQRAEARLLERLQRQQISIEGYQGWIQLDHETALLTQWFQLYKMRVQRVVKSLVETRGERELTDLINRCESLAKSDIHDAANQGDAPVEALAEIPDWTTRFQTQLQPLIDENRRNIENALSQFHQGLSTRTLVDIVEARIAHLPEHIHVLAQEADRSTIASTTFALALRTWITTQLERELVLRFVEFNERGSALLTAHLTRIENATHVLEFNLLTAQRNEHTTADVTDLESTDADGSETDNFARSGLLRAHKLFTQAQEQLLQEAHALTLWIQQEIDTILRTTFQPLHERRLGEVQRELARLEAASFMARGETLASEYLRPLMTRLRTGSGHVKTYTHELLKDLRAILGTQEKVADRNDIRQILYAGQPTVASLAPPIYRRLFTPVPLDIQDFYVARPALEQACIQTISQWLNGHNHSILVTGTRGIGKRTLVHSLVPARIHAEDLHLTIRLSEQTRDEADLCQQLAVLFQSQNDAAPTITDFDTLTLRLSERTNPRRIVVLENADKIYSRTSSGIAMARRFLTMISNTSHNTLWIVIMNTPAATVLHSLVGLKDYFTCELNLQPLQRDDIERMIMARHQVSGFSLNFQPRHLNRLQRLRRPFLGNTVRQPPGEFFEQLTRQTHGNPHLALLYWLRAVELDPRDDARIHVNPLESTTFYLLDELSLTKKLILALLVQHGSLTPQQLQQMLREPLESVLTELDHLKRLGFVEILAETLENYRLRALAAPLVAHELRRNNLI